MKSKYHGLRVRQGSCLARIARLAIQRGHVKSVKPCVFTATFIRSRVVCGVMRNALFKRQGQKGLQFKRLCLYGSFLLLGQSLGTRFSRPCGQRLRWAESGKCWRAPGHDMNRLVSSQNNAFPIVVPRSALCCRFLLTHPWFYRALVP